MNYFESKLFDDLLNNDTDFIPLLSQEDEDRMMKEEFSDTLPILPIKNAVLFPGVVFPITAGRDRSIKLLQDAQNGDKTIAVFTQKNPNADNPTQEDLYAVGTIAKILKLLKMPDGSTTVILQGQKKVKLLEITQTEPYLFGKIQPINEKIPTKKTTKFEALLESIRDTAIRIVQENPAIPSEASFAIRNIEGDGFLINFITSNLNLSVEDKQKLLEIHDLQERAYETLKALNIELQKLELKNNIQSKVRSDIDQQQREYFLHQQMKTIQEELGGVSYEAEFEEFKERAKSKKWSEEIQQHFDKEMTRWMRLNPQAPDFSVQRNYLDFFLELPWGHYSKDNFDLKRAKRILDHDHFGMDEIKERILEYLAVIKLKGDMKSPIICLNGPPGVGKTSLGKSIAKALGRKYIRMSLGGVHDESEIRGHRKTYIGAMPGRILNSIKKAGTSNPVFVLDEIDKLGRSFNGDPSSALLEVLDPEQNNSFYDNFLEVGYDLSRVLFIATSNNLSEIQGPLLDRMEVIEMTGYPIEEKIEIAKRHLIEKQLTEHGLKKGDLVLGKPEIEYIITHYTRESGVRGLEKKIAKIVRHIALKIASGEEYNPKISKEEITKILGVPHPKDSSEKDVPPGVVTGLAWTSVGGDILFIESTTYPGDGKLTLTGNLGKVMQESATIAFEYLKSYYKDFGISQETIQKSNVHLHVPEGATPKDGPSAGIAMLSSMISVFTGKKVNPSIAMTGEITLRGKVLPVGGIKEKVLAAKRANIKTVILCKENEKDVEEIKKEYVKGLNFKYITRMDELPAIIFSK